MSITARIQPHDLETEQSVLATMLTVPECLCHGLTVLKEADFYSTAHKLIFSALVIVGDNADIISVASWLRDNEKISQIGGEEYLYDLTGNVVTYRLQAFERHCAILIEKSRSRSLITACSKTIDLCFAGEDNATDISNTLGTNIDGIMDGRGDDCSSFMRELVPQFFEQIEAVRNGKIVGVMSGFTDLDAVTGGFAPKELTILAGRPGMGKTAAALCIAKNVCYAGGVVHFASLEMGRLQLTSRLMSIASGIDNTRFRKAMTKQEINKLGINAGPIYEARMVIDDKPAQTLRYTKSQAIKTKRKYGALDLIIFDYLQLGKAETKNNDSTQQVTELARGAQALAKELNTHAIFLSQLNRGVERSEKKIPTLADLRQSGAIEECADIVIFCFRPGYYEKENASAKNVAQLFVAKNRSGAIGNVEMYFEPEYTRWSCLSHESDRF